MDLLQLKSGIRGHDDTFKIQNSKFTPPPPPLLTLQFSR